jgi:hypothetical protein
MTRVMRKQYDVARVGTILIAVVLIAGIVGCGPVVQYRLIVSSTEGGTVTAPYEGVHTYDQGTVVNLVAEAEDGYRFVSWTGDTDTIDNPDAASANITINGDYIVTANFALADLEIQDWYDLDAVRDDLSRSYVLMNDLGPATPGYEELASATANGGKGWQPIGDMKHLFMGTFDGLGHEINGLFISRSDETCVALFYGLYVGTIKNVGVVNAAVTGDTGVGGLLGSNLGTVSNCYSSASVTGYGSYVGGLAGWNGGDLSDSFAAGNVNGGGQDVGGLVGDNFGAIDDSYSTAAVTGNSSVGGLVGENDWVISNSYSVGAVTGNSNVGGLVGHNDPMTDVSASFWDIETGGQTTSDGGTGLNTAAMKDLTTYLGAGWQIIGVADADARDVAYIWNIVNGETYPFLSWQSVVNND